MSLPGRLSVIVRAALAVGVGFVYLSSPAWGQIPPGFEVIQISDDPDYDGPPAINNCGQIVFSKRINQSGAAEEIFLWDNGQTIRITDDNVRDAFPDINDQGTIVWSRAVGPGGTFEVAMWKDGQITLLTDNEFSESSPKVNNLDHVVWNQFTGEACTGSDIFFYDGTTIEQITSDGFSNQGETINDFDEIAWTRYNFCVNPWMSTIMLYSDGKTIEVSDGLGQDQGVAINNRTQVAWGTGYPDTNGIALWDEGDVQVLTTWGELPRINDGGTIAFNRWHDETSTYQQWLWRDGSFLQLTDDVVWNGASDINNLGEIVWEHGVFPTLDIQLMTWGSSGTDQDGDGDTDIDDFTIFSNCLNGPEQEQSDCGCHRSDIDHDGDVDLRDFAAFEESFGGA